MVTTTGFILCLCERQYGDNAKCPRHGSSQAAADTEPRYTLTDIRALAREYADEHHNEARLAIQQMTKRWLEWVEKKERKRAGG